MLFSSELHHNSVLVSPSKQAQLNMKRVPWGFPHCMVINVWQELERRLATLVPHWQEVLHAYLTTTKDKHQQIKDVLMYYCDLHTWELCKETPLHTDCDSTRRALHK